MIKNVQNTMSWTYAINYPNREEFVGTFYKKELQKKKKKERKEIKENLELKSNQEKR